MSKLTTIIAATVIGAGAGSMGYCSRRYNSLIEDSREDYNIGIMPTIKRVVCADSIVSGEDVGAYLRSLDNQELNYFFRQMSADTNMLIAKIGFEYLPKNQKKEVNDFMQRQVDINETRIKTYEEK